MVSIRKEDVMENKYQILMKTEMGEKEGILDLIEMDGILSGRLDILNHVYLLTGKMINTTEGWIKGKIQTALYILDYEIRFHIFKNEIAGEMETSKGIFKVEGVKWSD